MKQFTLILVFFSFVTTGSAQFAEEDACYFVFKFGVTQSEISNIKETIIRPVFPVSTYSTVNVGAYGILRGMFFYFRFPGPFLAVQPELVYAEGGTNFSYTDTEVSIIR